MTGGVADGSGMSASATASTFSLASRGGSSMGRTAGGPLAVGTAPSTMVSNAWRAGPSLVQTDPSGRPRTALPPTDRYAVWNDPAWLSTTR